MTSIELIVNDEQLDLYQNTAVALVLQSQNFNELAEKSSSFSRSFTIPKTDNNARILKNVFTFNIADRLAYNKLNAVLKVNSVEIGKGLIIIENDGLGYNEIRLTFYFDASPFYQMVSKKMLLDCNFNEFDHYYNHINIYDSFNNTKDYIYPFIQYQSNANAEPYVGSGNVYGKMDRMLPAIKFSAIIKAISKTLGYTFSGSIFNKEEFKTAIFPFSKGKFERDKYYYKRYTFKTTCNAIQTLTTNSVMQLTEQDASGNLKVEGLSVVPFSQYWNLAPTQSLINGFSTYNTLQYLSFPDNARCNVTLKCDVYINTANSNLVVSSFQSVVESTTATLTNKANGQVILPTTGSTFPSTIQVGAYELVCTTIEKFNAHLYYAKRITSNKLNNTISNLTFEVSYIEDYGTTETDRAIAKTGEDRVNDNSFTSYAYGGTNPDYVDVPSGTGAGLYRAITDGSNPIFPQPNANWSPVAGRIIDVKQSYSIVTAGTILPDITIGAFLKMVAQLFCCTIIVDENNRTIEFYSLEDIYTNVNNQIDWSSKIVNIEASTWNTRASSYGQKSYFKFAVNETEVPSYVAPSYLGELGTGVINVNDTTLDEEKKIIEIPYAFPKEILLDKQIFPAITYEYLIVWIAKFFANANNYREPQGDDKIFVCNYYMTDPTLFGSVIWTGSNDNNSFLVSTPKFAIGISANGDKLPVKFTPPLASKKTIGFNFAVMNSHRFLNYLLDGYKELNCFMILTANDIANIDYRKPIYIQQFNSIFYIQKINDWVENKPSKVELLKLI